MSNYVPNYRKKIGVLARKKRALGRLIARGAPRARIEKAAEEVRARQISVLMAKKSQIPACEENVGRLRSIDGEIGACSRLSLDDIVESCR
jgi:hypothetical protein